MELIKPPTKHGAKPNTSKAKNNTKNHPLKVVYISTPLKVTTSASGFRALVQRLTGKSAVWPVDPSDLESLNEFGDNQTASNSHNGTINSNVNSVPIITDESYDNGVMMKDDSGAEFPTAELSSETDTSSAASEELYFQPLDHDDCDDVLLFDRDMPVFDDHDFARLLQSDGVDFFDQLLV